MLQVFSFTFNPAQENTYLLVSPLNNCLIIDPGCHNSYEDEVLNRFIADKKLKPIKLINTHAHIDHVLGNYMVATKYSLLPHMHHLELDLLRAVPAYAPSFGVRYQASPEPALFLKEGDIIDFDGTKLEVLLTPGHSPGSICLYNKEDKFVIAGDVLFDGSIGRTDLPGGDYQTLIKSIKEKLFALPEDVKVYPGHGDSTTIGKEKMSNPYTN